MSIFFYFSGLGLLSIMPSVNGLAVGNHNGFLRFRYDLDWNPANDTQGVYIFFHSLNFFPFRKVASLRFHQETVKL